MRIALVAPGRLPVPVDGWGAVENVIWNYKVSLERLGCEVDIYNTIWIHEVIYELNRQHYDFIHLHFDLYVLECNRHLRQPYCVTSHCGGFSRFVPGAYDFYPAFNYLFADTLQAPGNIVFSEEAAQLYRANGYGGFLRVLRNPIETEQFRFGERGNGRAICIGRIQPRKQQALLARMLADRVPVDFVGPYNPEDEPDFAESGASRYLGSWDKQTLYTQLTDYSCLLLLSTAEGDPLVVKEALAAGLCVVVNRASSANLTDEAFITVLPDEAIEPETVAAAIEGAIERNATLREEARAYARQRFDRDVIAREYLGIIRDFCQSGSISPAPPAQALGE